MKFASTRLMAANINAMVAFYELVTEQPAEWLAPQFAEIVIPGATLAIGSIETVALFKEGTVEPGQIALQPWNSRLMTWMPCLHA